MHHIVALSGGKDSTALALRLAEIEPREYTYLCTPTGNELPELLAHWNDLEQRLGQPIVRLTNGTLESWITHFRALPNWRQRWCTRLLKIVPCLAYVKTHQPATLYVGLRADEEERSGIYSEDVVCRFPLREWGWRLSDVLAYNTAQGVTIPARTDCAFCFSQRISEWRNLWKHYPSLYTQAEILEETYSATFRSSGRDTWPARLADLRRDFESGRTLRGDSKSQSSCRVCKL